MNFKNIFQVIFDVVAIELSDNSMVVASSVLAKNRHLCTKRGNLVATRYNKHKNLGYNRVSTPSILTPCLKGMRYQLECK